MNTNRVADLLNISPRAVRALIERGTLPAHRAGRDWSVRPHAVVGRARDLAHLKAMLQSITKEEEEQSGEVDWSSLPTFGGDEPASTSGIWSWDATNLLTGSCASDLAIEVRS